jgi:hypothetical protein
MFNIKIMLMLGGVFFRLFYLTPYFDHLTIPALGCYN